MIKRETIFSPCRRYRYTLWREWGPQHNQRDMFADQAQTLYGKHDDYLMIIGLNPSTADEVQDDPTIRRCIQFAKDWGFGALCMTNAFAYRETDPRKMMAWLTPVGEDNNRWLASVGEHAGMILAAWGVFGTHRNRDSQIRDLLCGKLHCLGQTADGHPRHPLYVRGDTKPQFYA